MLLFVAFISHDTSIKVALYSHSIIKIGLITPLVRMFCQPYFLVCLMGPYAPKYILRKWFKPL